MKTVLTIEARMGSSRLPGKVLMNVCGKPLLQHQIERLKKSTKVDEVVVATTINPLDQEIINLCNNIGCYYFRGSEENVLDRLIKAGHAFEADIIVQTTGDCPLHDAVVIDTAIDYYFKAGKDYISNRLDRTYPAGLDTQVYALSILEKVASLTNDPEDLEHGSYYIYNHPELFSLGNFKSDKLNCPEKRWCLDYQEDYEFIKIVYERLYPKNKFFNTFDVIELLKSNPEIEFINNMHPVNIQKYEY